MTLELRCPFNFYKLSEKLKMNIKTVSSDAVGLLPRFLPDFNTGFLTVAIVSHKSSLSEMIEIAGDGLQTTNGSNERKKRYQWVTDV